MNDQNLPETLDSETLPNIQESEQFPAQTPPQDKKTKKWIIIGLVATAVLSVGGVTFFAYQKYQPRQEVRVLPTPTPFLLPTPLPTPTPTPDKFPNWKTYRNEKYGFEFRYPSRGIITNLKVDPKEWAEGECKLTIKEETRQDWVNPQRDMIEVICGNYFSVFIKTGFTSVDDYFDNLSQTYSLYNLYNIEKINIPGADEAVLIGSFRPEAWKDVGYPPLAYTSAVYFRDGKIYEVTGHQDIMAEGDCLLQMPGDKRKKEEILKSFKFFD